MAYMLGNVGMKLMPKRTLSSIILIASLAAILVVLAVLQYRWSGQVSEAEHERMHTSLLASMNQFRLQLNNEFQRLGFLFQPDASVLRQRDWTRYAANCEIAFGEIDHDLVRNVYLWISENGGNTTLLRLNRKLKDFEPTRWPAKIQRIRNRYLRFFDDPSRPIPEIRPFAWTLDHQIPLMVRTFVTPSPAMDSPGTDLHFAGCIMIELNLESVRKELFPELAEKYFGGPDGFIYHVAVTSGRDPGSVLYQSDSSMTISALTHPDARISLLENPRERSDSRRPPREGIPVPRDPANSRPPPLSKLPPEPPFGGIMRGPQPILSDGENAAWTLIAQHRKGSLESAVTDIRRKNLALSFGSLLLLSFSVALIIVSARRAQRLARLQIDFVAGISHELRTPLAVICSAGDNLAEGVTEDSSDSTRKYGTLIRDEGRKLSNMIEQTLQFAGIQRGSRRYHLRPESINRIVAIALKHTKPMIEESGFSVEKSLAPNLPFVQVDAAALSRVIQNLIQNAVKYSEENRRLLIRTFKAYAKHGAEVLLAVEDQGMGIGSEDLPHIFEPFYRGSPNGSRLIHGTGLGLFIVRETLASMGGSIDVTSTPGKGSTFTIHLRALPESAENSSPSMSEEISDDAV
jgi:signal transduction histidine kinase